MASLDLPELAELRPESLPQPSLDALKALRTQLCEASAQSGFKLQPQQRFLRRVLSPESPLRNVLLVHGTGTGKTCTAIQVAEEYILRPEFQDKKVFVVASAAVQDNFRKELFEMNRVTVDEVAGTLESKQCTGRRYLDMLLRIESEPKNWANPDIRDKLQRTADKILSEFYEFSAYASFGNLIASKLGGTEKDIDREWVHKTFDNRLLIIDEAHNIRESKDDGGIKGVTRAMENLVKTAEGLVLVLLTATPMYDTFAEIVYYMNLFLWNDRQQEPTERLEVADLFTPEGDLHAGPASDRFRAWCQSYVSYVKGENPFTFPFRLSPPKTIEVDAVTTSFSGEPIAPADTLQYLTPYLVESRPQGGQLATLQEEKRKATTEATLAVLPGGKEFGALFRSEGRSYAYVGTPFLTPEALPSVAAKFVRVLESIETGTGIVFVYSNFVTMGARLFAMALEEHGYSAAMGGPLLANPAYTGASNGKYILLTSDATEAELSAMITRVKAPDNRDGSQIRVIVAGPIASEGVDFRCVRQVHVLDPWWNMSRIEQVIGRGLRTCSHQRLPRFEDQNCTVYLHILRTGDGRETFDEFTYRTKVEQKAIRIARVRKVIAESAMDCPIQITATTLSEDWRTLEVPQQPSEGDTMMSYPLASLLAPSFDPDPEVKTCRTVPIPVDPDHTRPLSTYLDVRDELLVKVAQLLIDKPIWERDQLFVALRPYTKTVILFNLQQAIASGYRFKDSFGRPAVLESKGELYALAPIGGPNSTMVERSTEPAVRGAVDLPEVKRADDGAPVTVAPDLLDTKRDAFGFPPGVRERFSTEILNAYIFDHEFTEGEKRAYLRTKPKTLPFAARLAVPDTDYIVLGKDTFDPPESPEAEDRTAYLAWAAALLARFIKAKDTPFASLKNGKLTISKLVVEGDTVKRRLEKGAKKYEPIVCDTGENSTAVMDAFAKSIDARGVGLPVKTASIRQNGEEVEVLKPMKGPSRCLYIELLAREEHRCVWITPEELAVLYDGKATKGQPPTIQDQFTEAFRK
jgi:hypothetical protein